MKHPVKGYPANSEARLLALSVLIAVWGATAASCSRKPTGACDQDIDCPAGFDCRARACVQRDKPPSSTAATRAAENEAVASIGAPPPFGPDRPDAARVDGSADSARHRPPPAPAPAPAVSPPSPPLPPAPPPGREPMWRQRLKNT